MKTCYCIDLDNNSVELNILNILFLLIYVEKKDGLYYIELNNDLKLFNDQLLLKRSLNLELVKINLNYKIFNNITKYSKLINSFLNIEDKKEYWKKYLDIFNKTFIIDVKTEDNFEFFYNNILKEYDLSKYMIFILGENNQVMINYLEKINLNNYYFISDLTNDEIEQIILISLINFKCSYKSKLILLSHYIDKLEKTDNELLISLELNNELNL